MVQTVQVRFTQEGLEFIDQQVKKNRYPGRSEAVRDCVRKVKFLKVLMDFRQLARKIGLSQPPSSENDTTPKPPLDI